MTCSVSPLCRQRISPGQPICRVIQSNGIFWLSVEPVTNTVLVGRQPIFDRSLVVWGYELLFRSSEVNRADIVDGNQASAQTIYNALFEIGLDHLVGDKKAFINFTRDLLVNGVVQLLPPERIVLEVLEDVVPDSSLVKAITQLAGHGFLVALDDFTYSAKWDSVLPYAKLIKLDVYERDVDDVHRVFRQLKKDGVKLVAEKVETHAEFTAYKEMGFDYFQGYFFEKPNIVKSDKLPDNHIALLHLVAKLQNPETGVEDVEDLISQTVSLNYKLFRYINSAYFNLPRKFESVREAVVYIGLRKLKDMATLITLSGIESKSSELVVMGLTRARMCELLARHTGQTDTHSYFIVGLFSILDALLDQPLQSILKQLPLGGNVVAAIAEQQGQMGKALHCSIECEHCRWPDLTCTQLDKTQISRLYCDAISWATDVTGSLPV